MRVGAQALEKSPLSPLYERGESSRHPIPCWHQLMNHPVIAAILLPLLAGILPACFWRRGLSCRVLAQIGLALALLPASAKATS
jgi:hypothetical protein